MEKHVASLDPSLRASAIFAGLALAKWGSMSDEERTGGPTDVESISVEPMSKADAEKAQRQAWSQKLVQLAETRDKAVFAELFGHFAPRVKAYLMKSGCPEAQAEDLVQEALVTVWRKADKFDASKASAGTWIFTIARNLRIDAIRREKRPEFDADDPALVSDPDPLPDHVVNMDEEGERVRAAVKELPEDQAEVVRLSFFEDKPHSEIADELGIPLGTVKSRLRLAFKRIRGALGDLEQ